jgi:hypothetical protein
MTILFDVLTPENYDLCHKVFNRLFTEMPREIDVVPTSRTFHSFYNDKIGKIAVDVDIGNQLDRWISAIERYNRSSFRSHVSYPNDGGNRDPMRMRIALKQGIMHKNKFSGFAEYKYKYIFDKKNGDQS